MTCGIYSITSPSGKCYIGSSVNIESRWQQHRWHLRHGAHHAFKLQHAYKKYGLTALEFCIIEVCSKENIVFVEQQYLDTYKPKYNSSTSAHHPMADLKIRAKVTATMRTPEAREKAKQRNLARGASAHLQTPQARDKMRETMRSPSYRDAAKEKSILLNSIKFTRTQEAQSKMLSAVQTPQHRKACYDRNIKVMKPVICASKGVKYISVKEAGRVCGVHNASISQAAIKGCKAGGHNWYFTEVDIVI
jgi:group I intron endonuclease